MTTAVDRTWDYQTGQWVIRREFQAWEQLAKELSAATAPKAVWVALAVWTKAVAVRHSGQAATAPMQGGRMAVFAALQPAQIQESFAAEVLAVTLTKDEAEQAVAAHKRAHGDGAAEYRIGEHQLGVSQPAGPANLSAGPAEAPCIRCGTAVHDGTSWCEPCRKTMFAAQREQDPGDREPARPNTYTPPQDRGGQGSGM